MTWKRPRGILRLATFVEAWDDCFPLPGWLAGWSQRETLPHCESTCSQTRNRDSRPDSPQYTRITYPLHRPTDRPCHCCPCARKKSRQQCQQDPKQERLHRREAANLFIQYAIDYHLHFSCDGLVPCPCKAQAQEQEQQKQRAFTRRPVEPSIAYTQTNKSEPTQPRRDELLPSSIHVPIQSIQQQRSFHPSIPRKHTLKTRSYHLSIPLKSLSIPCAPLAHDIKPLPTPDHATPSLPPLPMNDPSKPAKRPFPILILLSLSTTKTRTTPKKAQQPT